MRSVRSVFQTVRRGTIGGGGDIAPIGVPQEPLKILGSHDCTSKFEKRCPEIVFNT